MIFFSILSYFCTKDFKIIWQISTINNKSFSIFYYFSDIEGMSIISDQLLIIKLREKLQRDDPVFFRITKQKFLDAGLKQLKNKIPHNESNKNWSN